MGWGDCVWGGRDGLGRGGHVVGGRHERAGTVQAHQPWVGVVDVVGAEQEGRVGKLSKSPPSVLHGWGFVRCWSEHCHFSILVVLIHFILIALR